MTTIETFDKKIEVPLGIGTDNYLHSKYPESPQWFDDEIIDLKDGILNAIGGVAWQRAGKTSLYRLKGQDTLTWGEVDDWIRVKIFIHLFEQPNVTDYIFNYQTVVKLDHLNNINEIREVYGISISKEVEEYLMNNPEIIDVILDAHPHIKKSFGSTFNLRLEIVRDPEVSGIEQLTAYIVTRISVDDALLSLSVFDDEWFLDQLDRFDNNFNFNIEFI